MKSILSAVPCRTVFCTISALWILRRLELFIVLSLGLALAILELLQVLALVEFINVLTNSQNPSSGISSGFSFVKPTLEILGRAGSQDSGLAACAILVVFVSLNIVTKTNFAKRVAAICYGICGDISCIILKLFLYAPYSVAIRVPQSSLTAAVTFQSSNVNSVLKALFNIYSSVISIFLVGSCLLAQNPYISLVAIGLVILFSTIFFSRASPNMKLYSENIKTSEDALTKEIEFLFNSYEEIYIGNMQNMFYQRYRDIETCYRNSQSFSSIIALLPKARVEFIVVNVVLFASLLISKSSPEMALFFIVASQRLVPLMQSILLSLGVVVGNSSSALSAFQFLNRLSDEIEHLDKGNGALISQSFT